jgi:type II secretory pathway component PulL
MKPTLLVFCLAASVAGVDYAMDHWQGPALAILGGAVLFVIGCIGLGWFQAWKDARETDRVLKGGR